YQQINFNTTLQEYKSIFSIDWFRRLLARLVGLIYAIPVFYFLGIRAIPWRDFGIYFVMGLLFISQAFAGWIMVASGLVDRPSVSHFNLTLHLLLALALFGIALWTALGHRYGFEYQKAKWSLPSKLSLLGFVLIIIQIIYGGFTAGLKAGHVSDTWPLMFGKLIPPNLFSSFINIFESPQTIVFIHRWFGFTILILMPILYYIVKKNNYSSDIQNGVKWLIGIVVLQMVLGI